MSSSLSNLSGQKQTSNIEYAVIDYDIKYVEPQEYGAGINNIKTQNPSQNWSTDFLNLHKTLKEIKILINFPLVKVKIFAIDVENIPSITFNLKKEDSLGK